jgi:uncharacterized membrane protein (DUF2068 family)
MAQPQSRGLLLRLIALFKFVKAILLIATGIGALHFVHTNLTQSAENIVRKYHLDPGNHYVAIALAHAGSVTQRRLHEVGAVAFVYAALFLLEGVGLWTLKRWGEWLTVIITGSLLPFEIYELCRHPSWAKLAVLIVNAAIVWYLAARLRKGS